MRLPWQVKNKYINNINLVLIFVVCLSHRNVLTQFQNSSFTVQTVRTQTWIQASVCMRVVYVYINHCGGQKARQHTSQTHETDFWCGQSLYSDDRSFLIAYQREKCWWHCDRPGGVCMTQSDVAPALLTLLCVRTNTLTECRTVVCWIPARIRDTLDRH